MSNNQMDEIDRIATRLRANLQSSWESCVYGSIEKMQEVCESPIEMMLGSAMLLTGLLYDGAGKIFGGPFFALHHAGLDLNAVVVAIIPQYRWKNFRIDFALLTRHSELPVFVECDGHDFHERTKEQAARDRSKDRAIQQAGITILRFTGSEIYKDPERCVTQIINVVGNSLPKGRDPKVSQ